MINELLRKELLLYATSKGAYTPTESSPIQSSQTLQSRGVNTDRVESSQVKSARVPVGF